MNQEEKYMPKNEITEKVAKRLATKNQLDVPVVEGVEPELRSVAKYPSVTIALRAGPKEKEKLGKRKT